MPHNNFPTRHSAVNELFFNEVGDGYDLRCGIRSHRPSNANKLLLPGRGFELTAVQLFIKNVLRPAQTSQPGNGTEVIEKTDMNQRNFVLLDYLSQPFQIMETALVVIGDLY